MKNKKYKQMVACFLATILMFPITPGTVYAQEETQGVKEDFLYEVDKTAVPIVEETEVPKSIDNQSVYEKTDFADEQETITATNETESQDLHGSTIFSLATKIPVQMNDFTNLKSEPTENDVASVTIDGVTTYYQDMTAAFAAANGNTATIELLRNTSFYSNDDKRITMNSGNIILDGKGFTLTQESQYIYINGATLTIQNLTLPIGSGGTRNLDVQAGALYVSNADIGNIAIASDATINIYDGVTIEDIDNFGEIHLSGGTISNITSRAGLIEISGGTVSSFVNYSGSIEISGGTLKELMQNLGGSLKISGGTVDCEVVIHSGSIEISGGTLKEVTNLGGSLKISGSTISELFSGYSSTISISGGNITSIINNGNITISDGNIESITNTSDSNVTISGGNITSISGAGTFTYQPNLIVSAQSVSAGSITVEPLPQTGAFGMAEYSLDNVNWQTSNILPCDSNTSYTLYARYERCRDQVGQSKTPIISKTANYTISIPKEVLKAGDINSKAEIKPADSFDVGQSGVATVKIKQDNTQVTNDGKLKMKNTIDTSKEITSALLVDTNPLGDIKKNIAGFTMSNKTPVFVSFDKPSSKSGVIPAGTYKGTITFEIEYNESGKGNS